MATNDLIDAAGVRPTVGKEALNQLVDAGALSRVGAGHKNAPYRFWRPGSPGSG